MSKVLVMEKGKTRWGMPEGVPYAGKERVIAEDQSFALSWRTARPLPKRSWWRNEVG